jgi:hypothetical protein
LQWSSDHPDDDLERCEEDFGLHDGEVDHASDELDRSDDELDYPGVPAGRDGDWHCVTVTIRLRG